MKLLFDFFPIIIFFIVYKFFGIFAATAVAMVVSALQLAFVWWKERRVEMTYLVTFVLILLLGGATLFFHNPMFIKWKPTAIYWVLALFFIGSEFVGKEPIIKRLLGKKISLPRLVWYRLNRAWTIFFALIGAVNIFVVYNFSTDAWVNFKLFGVLGLMLVFVVLQSIYLARHVK